VGIWSPILEETYKYQTAYLENTLQCMTAATRWHVCPTVRERRSLTEGGREDYWFTLLG